MTISTSIHSCTLLSFPKIQDPRGNLTFIEENIHIPFPIERVYWIYDVPGGAERGGHAFREQQEVIIALSGSFDVVLDDGEQQKTIHLNRAYTGLYVPNMIWRKVQNFSTNAVAYVLASTEYDPDDYMFEEKEFRAYRTGREIEGKK